MLKSKKNEFAQSITVRKKIRLAIRANRNSPARVRIFSFPTMHVFSLGKKYIITGALTGTGPVKGQPLNNQFTSRTKNQNKDLR